MSKVTMQDIADALGISRVSVWKVINQQDGVSDALKESVLNKATELGYYQTNPLLEPFKSSEPNRTVALIVSRPDSSTFWTNIIHRIAQDLSYHNVNLMYTYVPSSYSPDYSFSPSLTNGNVQGAIVLNIYDSKMFHMINDLPIPTVFLDTVPDIRGRDLKGDIFLIEGYQTCYDITESIIKRGITDIGFIGDIQYARTNRDRYDGFVQCMIDNKLNINTQASLTSSIGIFSYYQELCAFLDSLEELPKAFVCVSDYVAHYLKDYFNDHPNRIPNGITITGFDGSNEYANISGLITTADVKTNNLGKRLSSQILYRMDNPNAPYELTYVNPEIIYRDSVIKA